MAGDPEDPVERMLIGQLALAHHNIGRLQMQSANAANARESELFANAASRLLGEFRRTALAIRQYRTPSTPPGTPQRVTFVGQQNNSTGEQRVALVVPETEGNGQLLPSRSEKDPLNIELSVSPIAKERIAYEPPKDEYFNEEEFVDEEEPEDVPIPQKLDARRPRKAPRSRPAK